MTFFRRTVSRHLLSGQPPFRSVRLLQVTVGRKPLLVQRKKVKRGLKVLDNGSEKKFEKRILGV